MVVNDHLGLSPSRQSDISGPGLSIEEDKLDRATRPGPLNRTAALGLPGRHQVNLENFQHRLVLGPANNAVIANSYRPETHFSQPNLEPEGRSERIRVRIIVDDQPDRPVGEQSLQKRFHRFTCLVLVFWTTPFYRACRGPSTKEPKPNSR